MRKWLVALLISFGICSLEACGTSSFYYYCHDANEIDAKTMAAITAESLAFSRAAFDGETAKAFDELTQEAKKNTSQDQLAGILQGIKSAGPYEDLRVERVITVTGFGHTNTATGIADCAKDRSLTESNVRVATSNVREQAYAVVSAKGSQERWIATLWLIPSSGKWQIQSLQITRSTVAGKTAAELVATARRENQSGHPLNAGILYAAAGTTASHGPIYHTGLEDAIQEEARQISLPEEFRGSLPQDLQGAGGPFSIVLISPVAINGKLYIVIAQEVSPWKDSREVEQKNRSLMKVFAGRFPEYSEVFGGLVVEATERGGTNGWRTVLDNSAIKGH
jgi:hypothetical protein